MANPRNSMLLLKLGAFSEGVASVMLLVFVPFYVRSGIQESSLTTIALILSLPAVTTLAASNFWGALADISGRYHWITSLCLAGFFSCLVLIPFMKSTESVIATVTILSLLYGAVRPMLVTQATLLEEGSKPAAISTVFRFESMGILIGSLLFALLYDPNQAWTGWLVFTAPALLCLVAAWKIFKMNPGFSGSWNPDQRKSAFCGYLLSSVKQDLLEVYRSSTLRRLSLVVFAATTSNFCFFGNFYVYFTEEVGGSGLLMGLTLSLSTLIGVACFPLAGRWVGSRGGRVVLLACILAWVGDYSLYLMTRNPYLVSLIFIVPIYPFFLVSTNALAAEISRSEQRGGGLGALAGVAALSMAVGTVMGGASGDHLGLGAIPFVSAVTTTLALVIFVTWLGLRPSEK